MFEFGGTANGKRIDLDEALPIDSGTRVRVSVIPEPAVASQRSSPASILQLAGTLSEAEAEEILRAAEECRRIDPSLWSEPS